MVCAIETSACVGVTVTGTRFVDSGRMPSAKILNAVFMVLGS
jgi:hypothetical protein